MLSKAKRISSSSLKDLDDELMIRKIALDLSQTFRERFGSFGYGLWSCLQKSRISAEIMSERDHAQQLGYQVHDKMRSSGIGFG